MSEFNTDQVETPKNTADTTSSVKSQMVSTGEREQTLQIEILDLTKRHRFNLFKPNDISARMWLVDADSVEEAKEIVTRKDFVGKYKEQVGLQWICVLSREKDMRQLNPLKELTGKDSATSPISSSSPGVKFDNDKIPYHLVSPYFIECVALILQKGAAKYAERNWEKGLSWSRCFRATLGHLFDWWMGREIDDGPGGTGLPHLWCAACNIMFLIHYSKFNKEFDDRPRYAVKEEEITRWTTEKK